MTRVQNIDDMLVFHAADARTLAQARRCARTAESTVLMGDNHLGYAQPVGGVTAYDNRVSLSGVGFDIACGNKAVCLDADAQSVRRDIGKIMDDLTREISFGIGGGNRQTVEHPVLEDPLFDEDVLRAIKPGKRHGSLRDLARAQLGTVGAGNHYVDLFVSERDEVWVGCHFGSRGLGHKITTHFLRLAGADNGIDAEPCLLDLDTELGRAYFAAMELAGRYAYAGRDWVCARVAQLIGADIIREVHNHHNFAWHETHGGRDLIVVRKGATPAFPGQVGFVGGSMGDISVILRGRDSALSQAALYSTVHGAGRVMSRTQAAGRKRWRRIGKGKRGRKRLVTVKSGQISREMMLERIRPLGVELRGGGPDEAPQVYKPLREVLAAHGETIEVLEVLHPIGVAMAPSDTFDPYKD